MAVAAVADAVSLSLSLMLRLVRSSAPSPLSSARVLRHGKGQAMPSRQDKRQDQAVTATAASVSTTSEGKSREKQGRKQARNQWKEGTDVEKHSPTHSLSLSLPSISCGRSSLSAASNLRSHIRFGDTDRSFVKNYFRSN